MQKLEILNNNNQKLDAYLFMPISASYIMIISHGFRGAKENGGRIYKFADKLNQIGIAVLAADFSGSGNSEGDFATVSLSRQVADLRSIINYAEDNYSLPVILLGRSFGGSTTLAAASADDRIVAYVLWSTPIYLTETFTKIMPQEFSRLKNGQQVKITDEAGQYILQPDLIQDFEKHDMDKYLDSIKKPLLVINGSSDELVDPSNALHVKEKVALSTLDIIDGADHRFVNRVAEREEITIKWLKDNLTGSCEIK